MSNAFTLIVDIQHEADLLNVTTVTTCGQNMTSIGKIAKLASKQIVALDHSLASPGWEHMQS